MTVARIVATGLLGTRRTLVLGVVSLLALGVALLLALAGGTDDPYATYGERLLLPVVTALIGLVVGASALGEERDDATILYLAQTTLPRRAIVAQAWLAAWLVTLVVLIPALAGAAWLALRADVSAGPTLLWLLVAVAVASAAYTALATLLALLTRRAVVAGMLYIVLWEGSVASFAPSADRLSVAAYGKRLLVEGSTAISRLQVPDVGVVVALVVPILAVLLAIALGGRRLGRMELP